MNVVPVPVAQVVPPSVVYCQVAPDSTPETVTVFELLLFPLFAVGKVKPIAVGKDVSRSKFKGVLDCEKWPPMF